MGGGALRNGTIGSFIMTVWIVKGGKSEARAAAEIWVRNILLKMERRGPSRA